jgi:fumarate hydratase subunit alpha
LKISMLAKGGGCENMSRFRMLKPSDGLEGVKDFILESIAQAGPNACPPLVVGVGVGGTFEQSTLLAKKALLRPVGSPNPSFELNAIEEELLERANRLGIGPQGYGGTTTALSVHIMTYPVHITSLPVGVNIECHAHRHKEVTL